MQGFRVFGLSGFRALGFESRKLIRLELHRPSSSPSYTAPALKTQTLVPKTLQFGMFSLILSVLNRITIRGALESLVTAVNMRGSIPTCSPKP